MLSGMTRSHYKFARAGAAALAGLLLCLAPVCARAETVEDASLKDWLTLSALLRSKGVNTVASNWQEINSMCLGLKAGDSEVPYNRCRYEKAIDEVAFRGDANYCSHQANAVLPPLMVRTRQSNFHSVSMTYQFTDTYTQPLSPQELNALKQSSFQGCMKGQGWVNAEDWRLGRDRNL
jgi:hypothetical protein